MNHHKGNDSANEQRRQLLVLTRLELAYRALHRLRDSLGGYDKVLAHDILNDVEQAILIFTDPNFKYPEIKPPPEKT